MRMEPRVENCRLSYFVDSASFVLLSLSVPFVSVAFISISTWIIFVLLIYSSFKSRSPFVLFYLMLIV